MKRSERGARRADGDGGWSRGWDAQSPREGGTGGTEDGWYRGLKSNFPATGMRGMWAELYINDPDILSDVTEIAVKKLGYWSESRSRVETARSLVRSLSSYTRVYTCIRAHASREHTRIRTPHTSDVENSIDQIAREKSGLHGRLRVFCSCL